MDITWHQNECLSSEAKITAMSCGRGAGKTSSMCIMAILGMASGKKVLCVEPINAQFRTVLSPEMNLMLDRMGISATFNRSTFTWKRGGGEIVCVSAEAYERLRGISEVSVLCMDECGSFDEIVYNLAIPTMRGNTVKKPKIYLFSTSTPKSHWFCKKATQEGNKLIYATSADNPFNGPDYYPSLLEQYKDLPQDFIDREIYGKFTDSTYNTIFTTIKAAAVAKKGQKTAGLDLALGGDYTAFAMFDGNVLAALEKRRTAKPEDARAFIRQMCAIHKPAVLNFDVTGHGSYAEVDKWGLGCKVNAVNFGAAAGSRYADMRTKLYFDLYFKLQDFFNGVEAAKFEELKEDLQATTIDDNDRAKVKLIKKDEIKKLIGRSPDFGDAAALAALAVNDLDFVAMRNAQIANNPWR